MNRRLLFAVMAAILICGASVFTACSSNDDNPAGQTDVSAISDKVWAYSQTHPDGFTLDIRTMTYLRGEGTFRTTQK